MFFLPTFLSLVQCVPIDERGLPDLAVLEAALQQYARAPIMLGTFTAGSNVTGIVPEVHNLAALLHRYRLSDYIDIYPEIRT
jgi:selenocysteine lyase/cysteine desulfurase